MEKKFKVKITELTKRQSDEILDFLLKHRINTFRFSLWNLSQNPIVIRIEEEFMTILKSFRTENKFVYVYNQAIVNLLKHYVIEGILPNSFQQQFDFQDFVFFKDDIEFFVTTTHEQIGIFYLDEAEFDQFKRLNIDFEVL